ncbi:MAG TPA: hydroxyisourate hydrolase [Rhabdaerophilum sp.]|nr:hydroxyisourate hydrolase [Rhabdaerophilum sp.]
MSIHVVDVTCGRVAVGMRVRIERIPLSGDESSVLADGVINAIGLLASPALEGRLPPGRYRARFHVADYYKKSGAMLADIPFLDIVTYDFGIDDAEQHYHLPFKCTPWGYSCFRGGA